MSFNNVGQSWSLETLREELQSVRRPQAFNAVTLHHTAAPSLAQRPRGFTAQHIVNIRNFHKASLVGARVRIFSWTNTSSGACAHSTNAASTPCLLTGVRSASKSSATTTAKIR